MEEISVKSIQNLNKKNKSKSSKIAPITILTEESKDNETEEDNYKFPEINSSKNILGIRCSERVSKLICSHISQFSEPLNQENKIVSIIHYCLPQNKISFDCYYIVKNIIYSILTKCPEILSFFKLLDLDIDKDIFYNDSETVKRDYTEIFIRFIKTLRELKLDYNIVILISQVDCGYVRDNLHNFIYLMRQALMYMPVYLKFVLTFTEDSIIDNDEISRVLLLNSDPEEGDVNEIHILSEDIFERYGDNAIDLLNLSARFDQEIVKEKWENDFERILDLSELLALKIDEEEIFAKYDLKLAAYLKDWMDSWDETNEINILLRVLCCTKVPIEIDLLAKIWGLEEEKLK